MTGPVVRLAWRQTATIHRLRRLIAEQARALDDLQHENAVLRTRVKRWRRTAEELAPAAGERAVAMIGMQGDSDDIADLPECEER